MSSPFGSDEQSEGSSPSHKQVEVRRNVNCLTTTKAIKEREKMNLISEYFLSRWHRPNGPPEIQHFQGLSSVLVEVSCRCIA